MGRSTVFWKSYPSSTTLKLPQEPFDRSLPWRQKYPQQTRLKRPEKRAEHFCKGIQINCSGPKTVCMENCFRVRRVQTMVEVTFREGLASFCGKTPIKRRKLVQATTIPLVLPENYTQTPKTHPTIGRSSFDFRIPRCGWKSAMQYLHGAIKTDKSATEERL